MCYMTHSVESCFAITCTVSVKNHSQRPHTERQRCKKPRTEVEAGYGQSGVKRLGNFIGEEVGVNQAAI